MNLPRPTDRLADCIWLPRIIAKARLLATGALPEEYAQRFCHPSGVDAQFLAFFHLTRDDVLSACRLSDEEVAAWFLSAPERSARVAEWNHLAVNLGRPGFPLAERLPAALATSYKHLAGHAFATVFEVLEADEAA